MDLSNLEFFGLAVTSGAVAGVANQVARFGHDWLARRGQAKQQTAQLEHQRTLQTEQLNHQKALQQEQRSHEARLRLEGFFFDARKEFLPLAMEANDWIDWEFADRFGGEVDYYILDRQRPKLGSAGEAVAALLRVAGEHPSANVRQRARRIGDGIDGAFNMPDPNTGRAEPSDEQMREWMGAADDLILSMHDPDFPAL
ncbi:hypothetical protein [Nocardioides sp.]|uniref:hypothetical protein n=1 Tax=Nocardioides sp. TaxID=35761 RepID=UPI00263668F0|nr:hypothetical protein [Nocardioides sp.]MCW2735458.1 hypothetical protein [Nocardioides sp.]